MSTNWSKLRPPPSRLQKKEARAIFCVRNKSAVEHNEKTVNIAPLNIPDVVAIDCRLAEAPEDDKAGGVVPVRVSLADARFKTVLDVYIKPGKSVEGLSITERSSLSHAPELLEIIPILEGATTGKILVGYNVKYILKALKLPHPVQKIRDLREYFSRKPLKELVRSKLREPYSANTTEGAVQLMKLYLLNRTRWEESLRRSKAGA